MAALSPQCLGNASDTSGPIIEDVTELCDRCIKLTEAMVEDSYHECALGKTIGSFEPSPETCRLCEIMSMYFYTNRQRLRSGGSSPPPIDWKDIELHIFQEYKSSHSSDSHPICGIRFSDLELECGIWADEGSLASATLIDRSPILGPHMNKVCDLVQRWRNECNAHESCMPGDDNPMPSRVIALCGDDTRPSVQIIESKGQKGRYLALSHCWGSNEKRPLRTTPENYHIHQIGIPFGDLPKTFQDTVELAQGIGIKYVWIDSLCIIQGNSQDWDSEAAKMGDVYRNAALVVAASGAHDSSEGLFISNRPLATVLRLPYRIRGRCEGTFNMMLLSERERRHPQYGPLEQRAWTLQERYLARRLVSFMPNSISWACNRTQITETGECFAGFSRRKNWTSLLQDYTLRSLTFASDRVEALRGIAQYTQRYRKDRYITEYGVWEKDFVLQLLWFDAGSSSDKGRLVNMPSWSWAATGGAKEWPSTVFHLFSNGTREEEKTPEQLGITAAGHLQVFGYLSTIQPTLVYARNIQLTEVQKLYWPDGRFDDGFDLLTQDIDGNPDKIVLGIARLDKDKTTAHTHTCLLSKQVRTSLYPRPPFAESLLINNVIYHIELRPAFLYWVLLLELVEENRFERVGIAILFPAAYDAFKVKVQEFEII